MTIIVRTAKAFPAEPAEPSFPYLAGHANKGPDTVLIITGPSEEKPERRVGFMLNGGEPSTPTGWGLNYIRPLPKGSAILLVQQ